MKKERVIYYDYLRVGAILAVVMLHIAAQNWYGLNGRSLEWNILNFYDSLVRWGVPIFVMISGSLFLNKDCDISKIYKKNIFRLVVVYFVWSFFYDLFVPLDDFFTIINGNFSIKNFIIKMINGSYHMWFIPMIIGLYMCIPIFKKISDDDNIVRYFLILSLLFSFIVPQIVMLFNDFVSSSIIDVINVINNVITGMGLQLVLGFSFYFLLGYYLDKMILNLKQRKCIYFFGIVCFWMTFLLNSLVAWKNGIPCQNYYSNFSINVLLEVVAIHTFFKYKCYNNAKINGIVLNLSRYSFGIYLIHVFIIELFSVLNFHTLMFNPLLAVPFIFFIVLVFSILVSLLLNNIPKISKWIV